MAWKLKASRNLFLNENYPFLHGSDCKFCNTIRYLHFMLIIYVWCISIIQSIIQERWWMAVHESVMEIQIWIIISGNWTLKLYGLPMICSNSHPVTSLVELWNLAIYKDKTIHTYLTSQIHYSNFECFIYGLIVRFSINIILKIQFSKLVWYVTQLYITVSSYIVMNFHGTLLKSKTKKGIPAHIFLNS